MKPRFRIYVTSQIPQACLDTMLQVANVTLWDSSDPVPRGELLEKVKHIDGLLCMSSDKINTEVINNAGPRLRVIGTMSEDSRHIDVAECRHRGIPVITLPQISTETVAKLTIALLKQTMEDLYKSTDNVTDCNSNVQTPDSKFEDKTVGIIGCGRVGQAVAGRFLELGVRRLLCNDVNEHDNKHRGSEFVTFGRLLSESDIVCICCKALEHSAHFFDMDAFKKMKKSAILIDCYSTGDVINYSDLYLALRQKTIFAAGLDVRDIKQHHPFKSNLSLLHNCNFFPFKECNKCWDRRSAESVSVAQGIISALQTSSSGFCER